MMYVTRHATEGIEVGSIILRVVSVRAGEITLLRERDGCSVGPLFLKRGERAEIRIDGYTLTVDCLSIQRGQVRLGLDAPFELSIRPMNDGHAHG